MSNIIIQHCTKCDKQSDSILCGYEISPRDRGTYVIGECMECKTRNRSFIREYLTPEWLRYNR